MTYNEWLKTNSSIDTLVAKALPPLAELEKLTFDAILDQHKGTVAQLGRSLGIDLTHAEVEEIVFSLIGVKEPPEFRQEHYDVLC